MSMHLVGPYMTTTNYKKRRNTKFRSAEAKARFIAEQEAWAKTMQKHGVDPDAPKKKAEPKSTYRPNYAVSRDTTSKDDDKHGIVPGVCAKPEPKVYTGDRLIGIAVMHKSNLVPVFRSEDAKEIANMRR
jgi:hypothetical protein